MRLVYRQIDEAFPLVIKGAQGKANLDVDALKQASIKLSGEYASKVEGLLYALDYRNQSLMMSFRAIYVVFQSDPCGHSDTFRRQTETLITDQARFTELGLKIRGLIELASSNPEHPGLVSAFQQVAGAVGGPALAQAAADEIDITRDMARDWAEGAR